MHAGAIALSGREANRGATSPRRPFAYALGSLGVDVWLRALWRRGRLAFRLRACCPIRVSPRCSILLRHSLALGPSMASRAGRRARTERIIAQRPLGAAPWPHPYQTQFSSLKFGFASCKDPIAMPRAADGRPARCSMEINVQNEKMGVACHQTVRLA